MPPRNSVNPMDNPGKANADIASVLASTVPDNPQIKPPGPDLVHLPGGLVKENRTARTAQVRELTGEHEEQLARASQSLSPFHFVDTLLTCGVKQVGDYPEEDTKGLLKDMLVGDREFLVMEIRRATYGDDIHVEDWECPKCESKTNLDIPLDDIPLRKMNDPGSDTAFTVPLRRGKTAQVRLANGHDQVAIFENTKLVQAERDTILLSRCIISTTDTDGNEVSAIAWPTMALKMSIPDRKAILKQLADRQPGPRYNELTFEHKDCGEQVTLMIGIGDLFPDI